MLAIHIQNTAITKLVEMVRIDLVREQLEETIITFG
jgi:hypothetical protein